MNEEQVDVQQTSGSATALHLAATFVLFVALNFVVGTLWFDFVHPGLPTEPFRYRVSDLVYGFLTYGLALWLALEASHRVFKRSNVGVITAVCAAISIVILLVRLWAIVSVSDAFDTRDQDAWSYVWLSMGVLIFQTICSLAAIWLFHKRAR